MASTPHHQANLVALPAHTQSDTGLTSHIASRYHAQLPVSNLSSQAIVSINTYTSSSRGPNGGKEGSAMGSMEELASRIWTRLGSRQENQAAVYLYVTSALRRLRRGVHHLEMPGLAHSFSTIPKRSFILTTS
jgi:chitin synthase